MGTVICGVMGAVMWSDGGSDMSDGDSDMSDGDSDMSDGDSDMWSEGAVI